MRLIKLLSITTLILTLTSCKDKVTSDNVIETVRDTPASTPGDDDNQNEPSPYTFDGAKSSSKIGMRGFQVHWDTNPNAGSYHVFLLKDGKLDHQKSFNHPKSNSGNTLVNSLEPDTEYTVIVRMMDNEGRLDQNDVKLTVNTLAWPAYSNTKSVQFNGSQSISLGSSTSLINSNKFTISTWFKTATTQSDKRIINFHHASTAGSAVNFNVDGTNLVVGYKDDTSTYKKLEINFPYNDGSWHHMALTYNGKWFKVYIDGNLEKSLEDSFIGFGSHPASIGSYTGIQNGFTGLIDEVSLWRSAIGKVDVELIWNNGVPTDIRQHRRYVVLRAYYRLGDHSSDSPSSITDVYDATFNSPIFNGTPIGLSNSDFVLDTP